ncbi:MAG: CdaR family protein [Oscillospiraceae bacterium]|nr:CdaR family protein [Oscillospiraceae bacterium]
MDIKTIKTPREFFRDKNIWPRLLSLLGAFIIWFYVISIDSPGSEKEFKGINIDLQNENQLTESYGFSVLNGYGFTCDMTLYGKKSELNKLKTSELSAYVDLSSIDKAGNYELDIVINAPNGMSVTNIFPSTINVFVDKTSTKTVPVKVIPTYTKDKDITIESPKLNYSFITVTGPFTEIEDITEARLTVDLGNVTKSVDASGKIALLDKDGETVSSPYIKTNVTDVVATFSVYKSKTVPITVNTKHGLLGPDGIKFEISPATVRVKGDPAAIDALEKVVLATIDEKQIVDDQKSYVFSLVLPVGIEKNDNVDTVNVEASLINSSLRTMNVNLVTGSNVSVISPPGNQMYTFKSASLNVKIRGDSVSVATASVTDLRVVIDLSQFNQPGIYSVPVSVEFKNQTGAYVIGEYTTEVNLI